MTLRKSLALVSTAACVLSASAARAQNVVHITGQNYVFIAPDTIPEGLTIFEFRNGASETHEAILRRVPEGRSVRDVLDAYATGQSAPELEPAGGPNIVDPGQSARTLQRLKPGTYVWICVVAAPDNKPHTTHGMSRVMVVTRRPAVRIAPAEPQAANEIHLTDFAFTFAKPLAAGGQWVKVSNDGMKPHEVVIFRLDTGKNLDDVKAWQKLADRYAPKPFTRIGGIAAINPGEHAYIWMSPKTGGYIFRCRIDDKELGKTHTQLGMQTEVHVK